MLKFNYITYKYENYEPPTEWNCPMYTDDIKEIINCVQCGKKFIYGDGYTSLEVRNHVGLGYAVCGDCYEQEHIRKYGVPTKLR